VPFLVKDLGFYMKGVECSDGSRLSKGNVPSQDDTVVKRYRDAGLVIFGRTHSPESGLTAVTESALHGITRNPWNRERTAGGSSGGTAAAIAVGIVPMGSGNDGGGSIRIPASCCGLFGLKPTRARVPWGPNAFELWGGLAISHAITRSVRDSAALLDASAGPELGDAYSAPPPARPFLQEVGAPPGVLRVGLTFALNPAVPLHDECRQAAESAAKLCESLGHHVEEVSEGFSRVFALHELHKAVGIIVEVETAAWVKGRLAELKRDLQEDDVEPVTREMAERAKWHTAADMLWARATVHRASRQMAQFQRDYDVILTPTLGKPPVVHGELSLSQSYADFWRHFAEFIPFTPLANWTGQPAMSVPLHSTPDGLPVGVHFFGRFGDEATLFRLAAQLEKAQPWADKRPAI
jgi:Asp-tRNA(Asn)/Glu-tRNA(Gln) amidotransferase A subunit family amidase